MSKKKLIWAIVSLAIAALSIWAVISQSAQFSFAEFGQFIEQSNKWWLFAAFLCMFGFIWFEGIAISRISGALGHKRKYIRGTVYGAADVYFSAITPSASGGQPASAYFMMRDGIPGTATTVTLLVNLIMYTIALLFLGIIFTVFRFDIVVEMSLISKILIIVGVVVLIFFATIFYLLLKKAKLLYSICDKLLKFFTKIHLLKHGDKTRAKLNATMEEYQECAREIHGKKRMLLEALFWNIMQRISQFGVAFFVFLARGEGIKKAWDVFGTQCFVSLGSNCVPIPGSMGVADYLMLDGYANIVGGDATNMELLCRSMSFYGCIILSGLIVICAFVFTKKKGKN